MRNDTENGPDNKIGRVLQLRRYSSSTEFAIIPSIVLIPLQSFSRYRARKQHTSVCHFSCLAVCDFWVIPGSETSQIDQLSFPTVTIIETLYELQTRNVVSSDGEIEIWSFVTKNRRLLSGRGGILRRRPKLTGHVSRL